ncbi:unnamed protein product [Protopolystoma xenopodis]|uniref:Uncharacterized protein n=1 Tax=Protopolystoma xenopodis TaxID=117903 RepID=A0A3S5AR57_9PLAT|nr:unnamed protein product [Protopolystoma xenopodis]
MNKVFSGSGKKAVCQAHLPHGTVLLSESLGAVSPRSAILVGWSRRSSLQPSSSPPFFFGYSAQRILASSAHLKALIRVPLSSRFPEVCMHQILFATTCMPASTSGATLSSARHNLCCNLIASISSSNHFERSIHANWIYDETRRIVHCQRPAATAAATAVKS